MILPLPASAEHAWRCLVDQSQAKNPWIVMGLGRGPVGYGQVVDEDAVSLLVCVADCIITRTRKAIVQQIVVLVHKCCQFFFAQKTKSIVALKLLQDPTCHA